MVKGDECNDSGYFSEPENGQFNLEKLPSFTTFVVEGPTVNGYHPKYQTYLHAANLTSTRHAGSLHGHRSLVFHSLVAHHKKKQSVAT